MFVEVLISVYIKPSRILNIICFLRFEGECRSTESTGHVLQAKWLPSNRMVNAHTATFFAATGKISGLGFRV